ncbi:glyoxylase-like metal-dependent hydrolase (beta-lactamase superfamily II) [Bacillus oleivorans]|uniref:Glyoxylase-like metal-dependent hydrolase (Beta-lactamase superfamily II) n=1 Tax=Bacillus oleivorans TaxID=1448271 RepID=A0A285CKI2_9BACI|nr:MBL fold metallo-hydrolase [Bacillus oleivorans]SNX68029.1 glyoxylase-like metal-dependent hydrolase (beta-lactamase superfamily II) [Bacillus oleivorans]
MLGNWHEGIAQITLPTPFAVGDVHAYLIKGDALTLVDAGALTNEAWDVMQKYFSELGITLHDIDQIVLTHHHPDHVGLVEKFPQTTPILAHPAADRWLYRTKEFTDFHREIFAEWFTEFGVPEEFSFYLDQLMSPLNYSCQRKLDIPLTDGMTLPLENDWVILETPGHATSHISLYREKDQTLIGGDVLLNHISSNPILEPPFNKGRDRHKPLLDYIHTLEDLSDLNPSIVYPGHGDIIKGGVYDLVEKRLKAQEERAFKVWSMLKENEDLSVFEICQKLFPHAYKTQLPLTISETVGQLDYIEAKLQIKD